MHSMKPIHKSNGPGVCRLTHLRIVADISDQGRWNV